MATTAMREQLVSSPQPATTLNNMDKNKGSGQIQRDYNFTEEEQPIQETKDVKIQREETKDERYYKKDECSKIDDNTKDCSSNIISMSNTNDETKEASKSPLRAARRNTDDKKTPIMCPVCSKSDFVNMQSHIDEYHPEYEEKEIGRLRKNLKIPKVIGFQDLNFMEFSNPKFPLVAKNMCEERLHLSKDSFCFDCVFCGCSFPCESAREIHVITCKTRLETHDDKLGKKNKRKSTPKFHPQIQESSDSEDDKRNDFFSSLNLKNTETVVSQPDLADIQSIISVANIGLNVPEQTQSDKSISPENEEEQQDCFAAECRKMKLRGEFPCKLCSAIFPNLRALKGHNRIHISMANGTPSSPYRCNICTYNSLDKATLVRHMRSHNGDRPYECSVCNYAFTTKANCERHLRNRHCKITREEVKNSIIYHPSEDPVNDAEYQKLEKSENKKSAEPMNLKVSEKEDVFRIEHQQLLRNIESKETIPEEIKEPIRVISPEVINHHWADYTEEALDLSMNKKEAESEEEEDQPQDLSKSSEEFNNNENEVKKTEDVKNNFDFMSVVKAYSTMYPTLTMPQIHQIILTQLNFPAFFQRLGLNYPLPPYYAPQAFPNQPVIKPELYKSETKDKQRGLQLTSGGNILNENMTMTEKLQYFQQQALMEMMNKRNNEFYKQENEKQRVELYNEKNKRIDIKDIKEEKDRSNASVKMVIKNGVLMPKQKQRRYRTERPFSCEHCSARFTLRSNMERHIKQQHPQYWIQKSRSNVGAPRKDRDDNSREYKTESQMNEYSHSPIHMNSVAVLSRDRTYPSGGEIKWDMFKNNEFAFKDIRKDEDNNDVINLTNKEESEFTDDEEEEEETKDDLIIDEEKEEKPKIEISEEDYKKEEDYARESQPQDLASVSRIMDNAVTQTHTFQKYFQDGRREDDSKREGYSSSGESRRDEGERSEEEEGLIAGSTSSDENKSESESSQKVKKKSAYSLAPNRVSCPYCFRKFPWTSSLRRHVLTHTGQKPFKCTHCPLLFTTKSNCDRHLLRKHGREALAASSGHTDNNPGKINSSLSVSPVNSYTMRNVPERPYKCSHCPSSTFSTLSNLNKHVSSKHTGPYPPENNEISKYKNPNGPPNVTISPNFPLNIPKNLSIIPHDGQNFYPKHPINLNIPTVKVQDWSWEEEERKSGRKRSSSEEIEVCERKRSSPDLNRSGSDFGDDRMNTEIHRNEATTIQASDLPFKCHLCERSFGERNEALDHIKLTHPSEFQLLMSKGALETNVEEDRSQHEEHDDSFESGRGRFPDYANRKVMCAFCLRRFWSAEDLRRHMRTHTGERPFSCDVCQRRFTLKHSMLRHRKKHSSGDEAQVLSDEEHPKVQINHNNNNVTAIEEKQVDATRLKKTIEGSDLISNLLGIKDNSIIDQVLVNPTDAAKLLGVRK